METKMKNSSKLDFYLYEPITFTIRRDIKQKCKERGIEYDALAWQGIWASWVKNGSYTTDIKTSLVIHEDEWLRNPVCYLPESIDLIRQLSSTNFEGQIKSLWVPCSIFSIAIPKGATFNKQPIEGVFVSYCNQEELSRISRNFFLEHSERLELVSDIDSSDSMLIVIYKQANDKKMALNKVKLSQLSGILTAGNLEEYRNLVGQASKEFASAFDLNDEDATTQFEVLRFVVSFIVYMSAHPDSISDLKSIKLPGASKTAPKAKVIGVPQFISSAGKCPHYRNLVNERYYRNEWASWEIGSRWIPVNMKLKQVSEDE